MPSSFSRFLADDELRRVRELYLESIEDPSRGDAEAGADAPDADADTPAAAQAPPAQDDDAS